MHAPSTVLTLLEAWTPNAHAIITRDDVPDEAYRVEDADWPALVDLFGPGDCLGTLIDPEYLLTVAHCAGDLRPGDVLTVAGVEHEVAEPIVHPKWRGGPNDVALVRLTVAVDGIATMPMYRGTDEEGQMLVLLGRGLHGTGLEGERGAVDDGLLRRATNVVTRATRQWLEVYFESPEDPGVTDLEGVGAAGDSGGPALIETDDGLFVAGLNAWGEAVPARDLAKYGARDYSTRVSTFAGWVDDEIAARREGSAQGCGCATGTGSGLIGIAAAVLAVRRSRRPTAPQRGYGSGGGAHGARSRRGRAVRPAL